MSDSLPSPGENPVNRSPESRCLITGASGFIGGHLTRRLVRDGHPVRCLVRASSNTSSLTDLDVEIALGELTDPASLTKAVEGCRYVFHCAALVSDWATIEEITHTNVVGTRNLLDACLAAPVERFIHFSTTDVYGHPDGAAIEESYTSNRFSNWYSQSKLEAELELRHVGQEHTLDTVILRPATVYGPGSIEVVGEIARAIRARNMLLIDKGRALAGLCYVENLIDLAILALDHRDAPGQTFNVSDGLSVTWREFIDDLADGLSSPRARWSLPYWLACSFGFSLEHGYRFLRRITGVKTPPLLSRQAVQVLGRSQDFSNSKARTLLGWEPRVGYSEGLARTLAWLADEYPT